MQSVAGFGKKQKTEKDIGNEFCRSLCQGDEPLHRADGGGDVPYTCCHTARMCHNEMFSLFY